MVQPDLVVDAVLGGRLTQVGEDRGRAGDRLVVLPGLELIAEGVQVRIGADARVAEQVPRTTRRAAGLQDRERLLRLLGLQVVRRPDTGDAGADDQHVDVFDAGRDGCCGHLRVSWWGGDVVDGLNHRADEAAQTRSKCTDMTNC